jgi:lipid-binding SYLF domain-containing protein
MIGTSAKENDMKLIKLIVFALAAVLVLTQGNGVASAASAIALDADSDAALNKLFEHNDAAKLIADKSVAVLVFPNIIKAGFIVGAQYGEGVLRIKGETVGYYNMAAGSYGLQAGAQSFGYALFLMTDSAVKYLDSSAGWEVGVGPSVVVVDAGIAKTLSTTTLKSDVYAFSFDQKGLMAGLGLQGSKITKLKK